MADNNLFRLQSDLREALTPYRYRHVEGVVETAIELARQAGVDTYKAKTAAWLHDLAREWPNERLLQASEGIIVPQGFASVPALLHGPIAAHLGQTNYGIADEEILDAVRYHTTGRPGMTELDLVLFVADAIEPSREYPGVEQIREAADTNRLTVAARLSMENTIRFLMDTGKPLFAMTVMARNELLNS